MSKPTLEITKRVDGSSPIEAKCSACGTTFRASVPAPAKDASKAELDGLFAAHVKEKHRREDFSQAAARIVREATERD